MPKMRWFAGLMLLGVGVLHAQDSPANCSQCAVWNAPQKPFRVYGNTYFVGPHGLSSILITSPEGDVLIDGALNESAGQIADDIRALGFRVEDVKLIVNSHVHFDHAGGIAELQRMSGARVVASAWSAEALRKGGVSKDDPQYGSIAGIDPVARVGTVADGETVRVGAIALTAHLTPGHTPGGTSWTWKSCEGGKCLEVVYADSVTPVSREGYKFSAHPEMVLGFAKTLTFLEETPCDVLITPHPEASDLWERTDQGRKEAAAAPGGCKELAKGAKDALKERLAKEAKASAP